MKFLITLIILGLTYFSQAQCPSNVYCSSDTIILYFNSAPANSDTVSFSIGGNTVKTEVLYRDVPNNLLILKQNGISCSSSSDTTRLIKNGNIVYECTQYTALPVVWISLTATNFLNANYIKWKVQEINNAHFTIYKYESDTWKSIGKLVSKNPNSFSDYTFIDNNLATENNYYKIRQTDINGTYTDSEVIKASGEIIEVPKEGYDILGRKTDKHIIITK